VTLQKQDFRSNMRHFSVMALGAWRPEAISYGGMLSYSGRRFGAYIKGRSNFLSESYDYTCLSNGTSDRKVIWTTGYEKHLAWSFGVGAIVNLGGPLSLYAGPGYGLFSILWEDADGQWAQVTDLSAKGVAFDAGLVLAAGMFTASVGVSTIQMKKPTLEVGVGVRF